MNSFSIFIHQKKSVMFHKFKICNGRILSGLCFTLLILLALDFAVIAQNDLIRPPVLQLDTIQMKDLKLAKPAHLVLDTISRLLFVSDPGKGSVFMIDRKSAEWKEIFHQKGTKPDFIALDQNLKIIYWTDKSDGSIWRANYDGSSIMPITLKRNEVIEFLFLERSGKKLFYLDKKSMMVKSISTLGQNSAVVYSSKNFNIAALAPAEKEGFIYLAIESLENANIDYKTIYSLDVGSRKSEPLVKNCTNSFSSLYCGNDQLVWTGHNPGKLYFYSLSQNKLKNPIDLQHNLTDFVWDKYADEWVYLAEKEKLIFVLKGNKVNQKHKETDLVKNDVTSIENDGIGIKATQLTEIVSGQDSVRNDSLITSLKTEPVVKVTESLNEKPKQEKADQDVVSGKIFLRIHEIRVNLKSGNALTLYLYKSDDKYLYFLSSYYMKNDYPRLFDQENLFVIPMEEIDRIRINKSIDIEVNAATTGAVVFKPKNSKNYILYGGLAGLGADLIVLAAGAFSFPLFTLIGGGIGMVAVMADYDGYNSQFRAVKLKTKYVGQNVYFKNGIRDADIQLLKSVSMKQIEPDQYLLNQSILKSKNKSW